MEILVIEPCYFGIGYLEAARHMHLACWVVTSDASLPDQHRYRRHVDGVLVCPVNDEHAIWRTLGDAGRLSSISAVVAGNQFVTTTAAKLASLLGLRGVAPLAAERGVHKDLARFAYRAAGAPSLDYALVETIGEAQAAARRIGYPLVIKPTSSASSRGVALLSDDDALQQAWLHLEQTDFGMFGLVRRKTYLLEAFADGPEFSVELAMVDGAVRFAGVTEKWVTPPPFFVELGHVFPARVSEPQRQALIAAARSAAQALDLHDGVFHIELKWTSTGPRIIETNPRPGGDHITTDLIPLATGVNLFQLHLNALLGNGDAAPAHHGHAAAIGFVVAPGDGILKSVDGWEDMTRRDYVVRSGLEKRPGDRIRPPENSGDRIGFVIVKGDTAEQAAARIQSILRELVVRTVQ
ncbi:ATP-grasp domain-containing protein [Burkholderia sp. FERM BP-3421]|jgi:argininosuccinate lyase|uniref:ATP-grasp domain-containing protein n=1 Tax=Burkholderia sp. FERM BP-3421 TaxID=1494466 RepID=UPI0023625608|nr:ATP-grasp domain-containing protein [Burkholderia sp. FERM BP-3421]WDD91826.1 ATP-grasp domain-containing protein [Burkholderia sp. FERM BP-3421]